MEQAIEQIRRRVAPVALARERTLPVAEGLAGLLPEGGLVRGRLVACTGPAATSLALSLVAPAVAAGAWLALVDLPTVGLDAAGEAGIPLGRMVAVSSDDWVTTVAAAVDGFDVVLTGGARRGRGRIGLRPGAVGRVRSRIQQREAVVVVVGDPGELPCDGVLDTTDPTWEGLGDGHGRLCRRTVEVRAGGRRIPSERRRRVHLPAATGGGPMPTDPTGPGSGAPDPGVLDDARPDLVLVG